MLQSVAREILNPQSESLCWDRVFWESLYSLSRTWSLRRFTRLQNAQWLLFKLILTLVSLTKNKIIYIPSIHLNIRLTYFCFFMSFRALKHFEEKQRDVVYLGWPIASSYISLNAGGGGLRGLCQWVQLNTWSPNKIWRSVSIFNLCLAHCIILTTSGKWGANRKKRSSASTVTNRGCDVVLL